MDPCRMTNWTKKRRLDSEVNVSIGPSNLLPMRIMFCWGSTVHGELGLGGIEDENILVPCEVDFKKSTQVEHIACGGNYTIVITKDGQLYSCGNNDHGQLGHEKPRKRLQLIPGLDAFVFKRAACGESHTMAVNEWGQLFSWGANEAGQLGTNLVSPDEHTPRMVKSLGTSIVVQIACGLKHTLALTNNGELYTWGCNEEGQLGIGGGSTKELKPTLVSSLATIPMSFIACGGYHSVAVSKSGAVFAWGRNTYGQLGLNDLCGRALPCQLRTLRNIKVRYVACGENFTVFLTMDGGVFTCGAGMYGQLGHGNNANEILPRKVMELMGSTVTQICCGRRHTLALVASRGRVYAWGLGGAGQLGSRVSRSVTTPQVVLGPWVSPSGAAVVTLDTPSTPHSMDCVVRRIYSGGDHCFATVTHRKDNVEPDDCRILQPSSQVLYVTEEQLAACQRVPEDSSVDHELLTYLETVFSSQACMNASFLLANDAHYGCSSKHHGVDIALAKKLYGVVASLENSTIKELIFTCITESLLPTLVSSPPDVESLRIYLTLPFYHGFDSIENSNKLHKPFARTVLGLKAEAQKVVGLWWSQTSTEYLERLIRIYKSVVLHFIQRNKPSNDTDQMIISWDLTVQLSLDFLRYLNKLNYSVSEKLRVPYTAFHIPELSECIDIRTDYVKWLSEKDPYAYQKIFFCNYPFLFDAEAKTILLETDQAIQMQSAMNEAATRAITQMLFAPFPAGNISTYVTLNVSRENLVADALRELSQYDSSDLKKPLKVKFHNEEAEDAGGVKKEFFMLLLREILDPKYGMFKQYEETRTIWFSEDSFEDEIMYLLIGLLCGLVIYNFIIIDLPFPLALYKKLLREPVGLNDIKEMVPVLAKSLQDVLDYNEPDLEEVFCLHFEVTREVFGELKVYELVPNGSKVPVTLENKKEFVDLYVDYILNKSVKSHFQAFHQGFHKVCGGRVLELFHSHELMALIVGNENYDWKELEKNAVYKSGYTKDDTTIQLFWSVFHELPLDQKKKFLLFLTGSDRIPIKGMKAIKITIQPMADDKFLPVAHTCFDLLDLPRYQTRERLRYKLLQAIQQNQGFSLV